MADNVARIALLVAAVAVVGCGPASESSSDAQSRTEITPYLPRHWVSVSAHPDIQARLGGLEQSVLIDALASGFNQDPPATGRFQPSRKENCPSVRPLGPEHCVDGVSIEVEPRGDGYALRVRGTISGRPLDHRIARTIEDLNLDGWTPEKAVMASRALGREGFARPTFNDTPGVNLRVHGWEIYYTASVLNDLAEIGRIECSEAAGRPCAAPPRRPMTAPPASAR